MTRVWIDIDNPPQVQYLAPFRAAFERRGSDVLLTARDLGPTLDLLAARGERFRAVGQGFGGSTAAKAAGVARRALALARLVRRAGGADALLCSSRPSAVAARLLGIPSFVVCDYEYVDLRLYRLAGSTLICPAAITPETLAAQGFGPDRLLRFDGLKEDFSFAGIDTRAIAPYPLPRRTEAFVRVLVRPPAEESHYHVHRSRELTLAVLRALSEQTEAVVVLSPRYKSQERYVEGIRWANEPVVLREPAYFLSLLKAVDAVVSSGGTMLREAAYCGIPAYSVFGGRIGMVDLELERRGAVIVIRSEAEAATLAPAHHRDVIVPQPSAVLDDVVSMITERAT